MADNKPVRPDYPVAKEYYTTSFIRWVALAKALPSVVGDSQTHDELLRRVLQTVNEMVADVAVLKEAWQEYAAWLQLNIDELWDWFDELDVQTEINNKIDQLIDEGYFNELISQITPANWLYNKKIVVYGDSLSAIDNNYWTYVSQKIQTTITNRAIGGTTLSVTATANSGVYMVTNATDLATYDYVFVCYGTNDWQASVPLRNFTTNCVYGAVQEIINQVTAKAPNAKLVFVTPMYSYNNTFGTGNPNRNRLGLTIEDYSYFINEIANEFGVSCIDFYSTSGCTASNYTTMLRNDSGGIYVHPTAQFAESILSDLIVNRAFTACRRLELKTRIDNEFLFSNGLEVTAQDLASIPSGVKFKKYVKIPANSSLDSIPITWVRNSRYAIRFASSANCTITVNPNSSGQLPFPENVFNYIQNNLAVPVYWDFEVVNTMTSTININNPNSEDITCCFAIFNDDSSILGTYGLPNKVIVDGNVSENNMAVTYDGNVTYLTGYVVHSGVAAGQFIFNIPYVKKAMQLQCWIDETPQRLDIKATGNASIPVDHTTRFTCYVNAVLS